MLVEMKEFYTSPEAVLLCFRPIESLASQLTGSWNWPGSGELGGDENENPGFENGNPSGNDEEDAEDAD